MERYVAVILVVVVVVVMAAVWCSAGFLSFIFISVLPSLLYLFLHCFSLTLVPSPFLKCIDAGLTSAGEQEN